ncbi:MAG: type II toxin-antitoxin system RelE/ParE family toxin [Pyrinomonadaceae bacterium]
MNSEIIIRPEAKLEIEEAHQYYREIEEKLGSDFLESIERALDFVSLNPLAQPKLYKNIHRILLVKFPYAIFYLFDNRKIVVLACFHQRREMSDSLG